MTETQLHPDVGASSETAWTGLAVRAVDDPFSSAALATEAAMSGSDPALLLVFTGVMTEHEPLVAGVASVAPQGAVVAGAAVAGTSFDNQVVVVALGGRDVSARASSADVLGDDLGAATEAAITGASHTVAPAPGAFLSTLILGDPTAGDVDLAAKSARAAVDPSSGVVVAFPAPCGPSGTVLFHAGPSATRIGSGQAVAVAVSAPRPWGLGIADSSHPERSVLQATADAALELTRAGGSGAGVGLVFTRGALAPADELARVSGWPTCAGGEVVQIPVSAAFAGSEDRDTVDTVAVALG